MATTMSSGETSIKVVTFSGKKKDWPMWEEKFLARASHRGYKHILMDEGIKIPKSDEMGLMPDKEKVKKLNEKAYMELILSMDTDQPGGSIAFNIMKGTKKGEYKEGNAKLAWKNLKKKYAPMTAPSLMRMSELYTNAKLQKGSRSRCVYHIPGGLERPSRTDELGGHGYSVYGKSVEQFDAGVWYSSKVVGEKG